jgi:chromosome segregation protein
MSDGAVFLCRPNEVLYYMPEAVQEQEPEESETDMEETEPDTESENYDPGEVKINKVTFKGFKSFQQKTAIPLFEGLTAIVGENGNGKSNLLDGISFVFGRRSSNLRAEKMTQLIFNGGESRKAADYAKVTVYLDNSSGIFDEFLEEDEEAEEVSVARKITQAGSSMYKFQGTNCKKSKIDDIAKKANIDPEGYHFVRQGKVTEIVEQSNVERRKVIDELSGVAKFDDRKEEAEEELEEVEEKLQEQEILLDEKKEYLKKLKEEKELAQQYRELEQRKEKLEASILEVRKRALSNQLANINTDTSEKRERIEELEEELEELDQKIDDKQDRIEEIEEQQTSGNDVQHLENRIEKKKGKIENKRDKIEDLEDTISELQQMQNRRNTGSKAVDSILSLNKDGVYGAFQDLISAEDRFGIAVDTAAGGHMNDLVVKDKDVAMECINYLKRENIGRARTLPMDKIKDRSKSAKSQMAKKKKGVIGYATELVNYDDKYEKAVNHVFSDTLIAEDLDSVKNIDGVRVVTLDGDVMSRGGSMTGGKKKTRKKKSKKLSQNLDPEKKKEEKKEIGEEIESLQKDIAELKQMKERKEEEQGSDEDLRNEKNEIRDELQDLREKRQEMYSEKQKLKTKIDDVGSKKANLKAELENVKDDLEEHDFDEDELKLEASPEDLKKKKKKILRKQNSMGPVNMRAIDEYKEKKEEFDEFKDQVSEIRQEKLEIEDMIEDIDEKKRECFMETLDEIQESFGRIFTNLFDGGEAKLVLEDDDIEKGLKIRVKPPGKEPHIIQALSGGEKTMTAIAFVFAILEYEESPFYIMDEIDAALDKKNSKKLSELLKEYADENQFIVISHNEITVRHAERAYGVTMQDGVTKMRSIELEV